MKTLCIYHANCPDGFTAAYIVSKVLGKEKVELYKGVYGQEPPDVTDRVVVMVDFSYKRPVLLKMASQARSILIIDHHKSARDDLVDLPGNVVAIFNMDKSGAMLTWEFYHFDVPAPDLVRYVQDRDLWRFELENSKKVSETIFSYDYTLLDWEKLANKSIADLALEGKSLRRKKMLDIRRIIDSDMYYSTIDGYTVPTLNIPYFLSSDAAHIMAEGFPFAACYRMNENFVMFSLRSNENGIDVSKIAEKFGGGGHEHAAGFEVEKGDIRFTWFKSKF